MALAREQQLSALGGVVAAAAHELGTPLATIKLVSTELVEELEGQPEVQEDARLVRAQADRCTEILRSMGPRASDDTLVRFAPFASVVEEAAAPHADRGIRVIVRVEGASIEDAADEPQPLVARSPEIVQGLRNLVQNAVDFARTTVWVDLDWTASDVRAVIGDDGPGYPPDLIGRIGDPFVRGRGPAPEERPGYEGMGSACSSPRRCSSAAVPVSTSTTPGRSRRGAAPFRPADRGGGDGGLAPGAGGARARCRAGAGRRAREAPRPGGSGAERKAG